MTTTANDSSLPGYLPGTWTIDPTVSEIGFSIRQLVGRARGSFTRYDVEVVTGPRPTESSVVATIDLGSIDTGNKRRDDHLRGPRVLNVDAHPTVTFRSAGVQELGEAWIIQGDLTLHGTTHSVALDVREADFATDSISSHATFVATAQLHRNDFGIDVAMAAGGVVVSDKITITLRIVMCRQS